MEVTDLKFKKNKMLLGTMCALVLATTIGAFPSKAESAFDYNYYFWKYPDVANAVGFDPQALFNHYQTSGMAEGRYANQQAEWRAAAGHVDTAEERKAFLLTSRLQTRTMLILICRSLIRSTITIPTRMLQR